MKHIILLLLFALFTIISRAESFVYFQNNTSHDIQLSTTSTLGGSYWNNEYSGTFEAWKTQTRIYTTNRDEGVTWDENFYFTTNLTVDGETVQLWLRLEGDFIGSTMWQSAAGPGFNHPWFGDQSFYSETFQINGKDFILKYRADLPPGNSWDDVYFVLQEVDPYPVSPADLLNDYVFNVLAYNVFLLTPPIGSSDEYLRSEYIHEHIHGYDAIILSEAFYNAAREDNLIPLMSTEYPYYTDILDESGASEDGGVMIFSRWPIQYEDQFNFSDCEGTDCLSPKGANYARISKNGVLYHLFGTHTQSGTDTDEINTRAGQLAEVTSFVASQNIPEGEAVIIGGDLNVDKIDNHANEYTNMYGILNCFEPSISGHPYTYDPSYNTYASSEQEYLDYALSETEHLAAYSVTNYPQILRTVASEGDLWDNDDLELDLSDHFAVHGRFVYPYFTEHPMAQDLCLGQGFTLSVDVSEQVSYQWYHDGQAIQGQTFSTFTIVGTQLSDAGEYYCIASYANGSITSETVTVSITEIPTPIVTDNGGVLISSAATGNQWYNANGIIAGATEQTYTPTQSGDHYVVVTEGNCSSSQSNFINVQITGISQNSDAGLWFDVYPNPIFEDAVNVRFNEATKPQTHVALLDMTGRTVLTQTGNWTSGDILQLPTSNLSTGVYHLQLVNGNTKWCRRLVLKQ